jgi:hypothetical protein
LSIDFSEIAKRDVAKSGYHTKRSLGAMIVLAEQTKGIIERQVLLNLFNYLKISVSGQQRAFSILDIAFTTEDPDTFYIPIGQSIWNTQGLCNTLYTTTKSGIILKEQIVPLFIRTGQVGQLDLEDSHKKLVFLYDALKKSHAALEKKFEEMYHKWADSADDNERLLTKTRDLSDRLTRAQIEASKFQKSFTEIIQGMLANDEEDEGPTGATV